MGVYLAVVSPVYYWSCSHTFCRVHLAVISLVYYWSCSHTLSTTIPILVLMLLGNDFLHFLPLFFVFCWNSRHSFVLLLSYGCVSAYSCVAGMVHWYKKEMCLLHVVVEWHQPGTYWLSFDLHCTVLHATFHLLRATCRAISRVKWLNYSRVQWLPVLPSEIHVDCSSHVLGLYLLTWHYCARVHAISHYSRTSIKDLWIKGQHLSNQDTACCPSYIEKCTKQPLKYIVRKPL